MIKIYTCKYCNQSGTRYDIRKHLRESHGIRGLAKDGTGKRMSSQLTANTIVTNWGEIHGN